MNVSFFFASDSYAYNNIVGLYLSILRSARSYGRIIASPRLCRYKDQNIHSSQVMHAETRDVRLRTGKCNIHDS